MRGEQHGALRLEDACSASEAGHRFALPGAGQPLARGLAADARLVGGFAGAGAGLYAGDERPPSPGRDPCVRILGHGVPPCCKSRQLKA